MHLPVICWKYQGAESYLPLRFHNRMSRREKGCLTDADVMMQPGIAQEGME
jgi:hypothetical protein